MRILRAIQCGPHRILAVRVDRTELQWLDESCCGPTICDEFAEMRPCAVESPDPACTPPPGKERIWVCTFLQCSNQTGPWTARPGQGIRYDGICWERTGPIVDRSNLPPGAVVVEDQQVECIFCTDGPCGSLNYAEATPCDPAYNGPRPLYCPAGLPFQCTTLNPSNYFSGAPNACFEFRRDAPVQPYPPQTPVLYFDPGVAWPIQDCCQCILFCFRTGELPSLFQPPSASIAASFPGCCCGTLTNASVFTTGDGWAENYGFQFQGAPAVRLQRLDVSWVGTATQGNATIIVNTRRRQWDFDGNLIADENFTDPVFVSIECPLRFFYNPFNAAEPSSPFDPFAVSTPYHTRTCTRVTAGGHWEFPIVFGGFNTFDKVAWNSDSRLLNMVADGGCRNANCSEPVLPLPLTGGDGARRIDPSVAAHLARQWGGCRGCGDSPPVL